jgi:UDPglucose 6-dehydrogenase
MDIRSAELSKYAANTFLASRISFMNDIAILAEKLGADVEAIRQGVATDPRIGPHFLLAGCGYGGSCFPKDVKALIKMVEEQSLDGKLFRAIENINDKQKELLFRRLEKHFKGDLKGKVVALWGLAFKPHTDDMRDAPSRTLLELLWQKGVKVQAYDPVAMQEAQRIYGDRPDFILCKDAASALQNADLLMIVTEWDEFRKFDLDIIKKALKNSLIFDGRNIYDPEKMQKLGFDYYCIGRRFGRV